MSVFTVFFLISVGPQDTLGGSLGHLFTFILLLGAQNTLYSPEPYGHRTFWEAASGLPSGHTLKSWFPGVGLLLEFPLKNEARVFPDLPYVLLLSHSQFPACVQEGLSTSSHSHGGPSYSQALSTMNLKSKFKSVSDHRSRNRKTKLNISLPPLTFQKRPRGLCSPPMYLATELPRDLLWCHPVSVTPFGHPQS